MSNQVICDACNEPIDTSVPYYTGSGQKVQVNQAGDVVVVEATTRFDFHEEHVPWTPPAAPAQQAQAAPAARAEERGFFPPPSDS